jgi:phage tail-like protein
VSRRATDPVLGFRFVLEIGFVQVAGFSECTGLSLETKILEYKEGGRNYGPLKFPEIGAVGNITLKRGIVPGANADALFKWHRDVMQGDFDEGNNPNKRKPSPDEDIDQRCAILLQDEAGQEVKRWKLFRAFPVKWTGPELKATSSDVALETLELACEGLELSE